MGHYHGEDLPRFFLRRFPKLLVEFHLHLKNENKINKKKSTNKNIPVIVITLSCISDFGVIVSKAFVSCFIVSIVEPPFPIITPAVAFGIISLICRDRIRSPGKLSFILSDRNTYTDKTLGTIPTTRQTRSWVPGK